MELKSTDRVLLLSMPSVEEVRGIALQVSEGIVVGVLDAHLVYEARAALREHPNVMITPSDPDGVLPWRDEFFTAVYAPGVAEPSAELLRVIEPGGTLLVAGGLMAKR
jgi:hypothetical protein